MNESNDDTPGLKRKAPNDRNKTKLQRTSQSPFLKAPEFDSSESDPTTSSSDSETVYLTNLTPSTSEYNTSNVFTSDTATCKLTLNRVCRDLSEVSVDSSSDQDTSINGDTSKLTSSDDSDNVNASQCESNVSCVLSADRLDSSEDDAATYSYTTIKDELCAETGDQKEVAWADLNTSNTAPNNSQIDTQRIGRGEVVPDLNTSTRGKDNNSMPSQVEIPKLPKKRIMWDTYNHGILIVMRPDEICYFWGCGEFEVLHGKVELLGHILTTNSRKVKAYSFRGSSLLFLKNITTSVSNVIDKFTLPSHIKAQNDWKPDKYAVVFCRKFKSQSIDFIEKHTSQEIIPSDRISIQPELGNPKLTFNLLKVKESWATLVDKIQPLSKFMICGGKGVGKSTFIRYAINRLLMTYPSVKLIDLDPGQSECTLPGCISQVEITKPIFGPSCTHLSQPNRSFVTNINVSYDIKQYLHAIKTLVTKCCGNSVKFCSPTLINYMGYTDDLGINIFSAACCYIRPTAVIQICSKNPKKNYDFTIDTKTLEDYAKVLDISAKGLQKEIQVYVMDSEADGNVAWTSSSRQLREMSILSFLGPMVDNNSICRPKAPLYRIKLKNIAITDLYGEKIPPGAINGNMVALAKSFNNEKKVFECVAWALVRGVDLVEKYLVLQTNETDLDKVTHLIPTGNTLPPSLYMTSETVTGPVPYVMNGALTGLGEIPMRSRTSVKTKK